MGKGCSKDLVSHQDKQGEQMNRTGHDLAEGKSRMGAAEQKREKMMHSPARQRTTKKI